MKIRRRGRDHVGHFADAVWGGRARALLAAQRFRDELLQRVGADTRERRRVPKGRRSRTGIVGVTTEKYRVGGRVSNRAVATWPDPEKGTQRRRFSFGRGGRDAAVALAAKARKAGVGHNRAYLTARQREEAARRLEAAAPLPARVKDPLSRKGISMARRRRVKCAGGGWPNGRAAGSRWGLGPLFRRVSAEAGDTLTLAFDLQKWEAQASLTAELPEESMIAEVLPPAVAGQ